MTNVFRVSVVMGSEDAAWQESWRTEAARGLRAAADAIESGAVSGGGDMVLRDINGNRIGAVTVLGRDD